MGWVGLAGGGGAGGGAPGGGAHVPQFMVQMFQRALDESMVALKTSMHSEMQVSARPAVHGADVSARAGRELGGAQY
jgi:hypothetical protein